MNPGEIFLEALTKLTAVRDGLKSALTCGAMEEARVEAIKLTEYFQCAYCRNYRKTTDRVGCKGICGRCPLHKHGEEIIQAPIGYNGCYKIRPYRTMVKAAFWFDIDCHKTTLVELINSVEKSINYLVSIRHKLIPVSVTFVTEPPRL